MALDVAAELTRAGITAAAALLASFLGSKWAESRKLEARFEKLDRIREEIREVTRVQEEIKRQLQGGEWNRQTLWRQRLESYTQLLRVSGDYLDRCYLIRSILASGASDQNDLRANELHQMRADTFKAVTVVEIFGDAEMLRVLKRFFDCTGRSAGAGEHYASIAALSTEIDALTELQASFVVAAREQLKGSIDAF